nr:DUF397 domain-containing protein [Nocardia sienata]
MLGVGSFRRVRRRSREVAHLRSGLVGVRDSKNPTGPALVFGPGEWDAFTAEVRTGEFE